MVSRALTPSSFPAVFCPGCQPGCLRPLNFKASRQLESGAAPFIFGSSIPFRPPALVRVRPSCRRRRRCRVTRFSCKSRSGTHSGSVRPSVVYLSSLSRAGGRSVCTCAIKSGGRTDGHRLGGRDPSIRGRMEGRKEGRTSVQCSGAVSHTAPGR